MTRSFAWLAALAALLALPAWADEPTPAQFRWRAKLEVPAQASLVRVPVPPDALARLQSPTAADLRVFDAEGRPVPFAMAGGPKAQEVPRETTAAFAALPLHSTQAGTKLPKGAIQVRAKDADGASVWVQIGGKDASPQPATSKRLPAALFDTRQLKSPVSELVIAGRWPGNTPVAVRVSTSSDLATWTPVTVRGRLYRFDGDGAPSNDTLRLAEPLPLEQQFLRLEWPGHEEVQIDAVTGVLPPKAVAPAKPSLALPAPRRDGNNALVWELGFATPIAELELAAAQPNTLMPVRVLGRNKASDPWRVLGQTVVYRLGEGGPDASNGPLVLQRPSVHWLRVEATHGQQIGGATLAARVLWDPVQLLFVASGNGPYQLAAGRADTRAAGLPLAMLTATTSAKFEALPVATVLAGEAAPAPEPPAWSAWVPEGVDPKKAGLWAVLGLGVLVLGTVAWSLLRGLGGGPQPRSDDHTTGPMMSTKPP